MENMQKNFEGSRMEGISILYRLIAGMIGGAGGALFILMGMMLGGSLLESFSSNTADISPFATFLILIVLFLSTVVANTLGVLLIGLSDRNKYSIPFKGVPQVIVVNIILFILSIPIYFIAKGIDPYLIAGVAVLQFFFSSLTSALAYDVICTERRRILLNIYSIIIGIFVGLLVLIFFYLMNTGSNTLLIFFSVPIVIWMSIGFVGGLIEYFYHQLFLYQGIDFLALPEGIPTTQNSPPSPSISQEPNNEEWEAKR